LKDANLSLLTEEFDIPFRFDSAADISLNIQSNGFKVEDLSIEGVCSGIERVESSGSEPPFHMYGEFEMKNGLFGIPRLTLENPAHMLSLERGIFDKSILRGYISGRSTRLDDLLQRIQRYYPAPFDPPDLSGHTAFNLTLSGSLRKYEINADIHTLETKLKDQDIGSIQLVSSIDPQFTSIDSMSISGASIHGDGNLQLLTPGQSGMENQLPLRLANINIHSFDLSILDKLFDKSIPLTGITSGKIFMNSIVNQKTSLKGNDATYSGIPVNDFVLEGNLTDNGFENMTFSSSPGAGNLSATGSISFKSSPSLIISGHNIPFDLVPVFNKFNPEGNFDINVSTLDADTATPYWEYSVFSDGLNLGNIDTGGLEVSGQITSGNEPEVSWTANWNKQMLSSKGTCLLDESLTCSMTNQFTDFPLTIPFGITRDVTAVDLPVSGIITVTSQLTGKLRNIAEISSEFHITDMVIDFLGTRFNLKEPTDLSLGNKKVLISETSLVSEQKSLDLKGSISLDSKIDLLVKGNLGLSPLENLTDFLDSTSGNINLNLNLGGSMNDPNLSGTALIQEFYAYIPSFDLWLDDYHSEIQLNQKIGKVIYLEGIAGGSYLGGEGEIGFAQYIPSLFDVKLQGYDIDFEYPSGFVSQGNINLEIMGTLPEINFAGDIDLKQCIYSERINYKTMIVNESRAKLNLTQQKKPEDVKVENHYFNPTFGINVSAQDGFFMDNNMARSEMRLKLDILGSLNKPQVLGHVDVLRGDITFMNRIFEIQNASIDFADPTRIDPLVNFQAEADLDDYRVSLDVNGRFYSDLNIQPSSTPPLNDLDLWNLLLIGKTRDSMTLSSDDYLASGVAYITGSLQDQIEQQFEYWMGFDEFSIDPIMSTSNESPSAKFTVKKRIGPDLSVLYSRSATSTGDLLMIEYQITNNLFIIGQKTEDNSIGANIRYRWEFE